MTTRSFADAATGRHSKRPKVAKSKPATIAQFVTDALANPPVPPPKAPKVAKEPSRFSGIWATFATAQERSDYAKQLAAKRNPKNMARPYKAHTRVPTGWTGDAAAVAKTAARLEALELVQKLKTQGVIPNDDPKGEAATIDALTILRSPGGMACKAQYARKLLKFYHPELASTLV